MIWWVAAAAVALGSLAAELIAGPYGYFPWHFIPAFDLIYGFAGCLAIIVVSKALGKWFIQRPEGYVADVARDEEDDAAGGAA